MGCRTPVKAYNAVEEGLRASFLPPLARAAFQLRTTLFQGWTALSRHPPIATCSWNSAASLQTDAAHPDATAAAAAAGEAAGAGQGRGHL